MTITIGVRGAILEHSLVKIKDLNTPETHRQKHNEIYTPQFHKIPYVPSLKSLKFEH